MLHITSAQVTSAHCLVLHFDDGTLGDADLVAELTGPIFKELLDPKTFKQAYVDPELRTVCWPNGADFAPEFLKSSGLSQTARLMPPYLEQLVQEVPPSMR